MATKQASSLTAPNLSGLLADGSSVLPGIHLSWSMPASNILLGTEIWRNNINNRSGAVKIATVIGSNHYIDAVEPNKGFYYWIRGLNIFGKGSGAWYPESDVSGVYGNDFLPFYSSLVGSGITGDIVSDGTWQVLENFKVYNPTNIYITGMAIFACSLDCAAGQDSQFKLTVTNDPALSSFSYPITTGEVSKPSISIPVLVQPNLVVFPASYKIEFMGPVGGGAVIARRGLIFNWKYDFGS